MRSVEALAALGRALETEAPLIFQLMGQAVEVLQYRAIQDGLAVGGPGLEGLRELRATAAPRDRAERLRRSLGAEGTMIFEVRRGGSYEEAYAKTRGYYGRIEHRWVADGWAAGGLEYYAGVAGTYRSVTHAEIVEQPDLLRPPPEDASSLVVNLRRPVGTFQATEALARLARLALELAVTGAESGALPEELPDTQEATEGAFTGAPPAYERSAGGSATLTIPGAEELWRELKAGRTGIEHEAPLFTWRLAAPAS